MGRYTSWKVIYFDIYFNFFRILEEKYGIHCNLTLIFSIAQVIYFLILN